jgi:hypothetical protein
MTNIELDKVAEPKFKFNVDGKDVEVQPFETAAKMEEYNNVLFKASGNSLWSERNAIRKAFGFPTDEELDAVPEGQEKPKTLTHHQCVALSNALTQFLQELDVSKKRQKLLRS